MYYSISSLRQKERVIHVYGWYGLCIEKVPSIYTAGMNFVNIYIFHCFNSECLSVNETKMMKQGTLYIIM